MVLCYYFKMPPPDPENFISPVFDPSERGASSAGSRQRAQEPADGSAACFLLEESAVEPRAWDAALQKALPAWFVPREANCLGIKFRLGF